MIHSSAYIHPNAQIDPSVEVGPWCTVGPHVQIAKGTRLISHVVLEGWTKLGENNTIFPFSVLGAVPQDMKYKGEATQLIIGHHNTIRESVTVNLGTTQGGGVTCIGDHCLLMAYTHIGHDCNLGNHCIIANYGGLAGHVRLEDHVILGGMTGVSQFVRVGAHAYVGGQSGIEKDVPPFAIALGARPLLLKGTNIVGMKRRGFSSEIIQKINEVIKLWIRPDVERNQCLLEIESQYGQYNEVKQFVSFIRKSDVGVTRFN